MNSSALCGGVQLPRRRRRPALSCVECRQRKIKCNRNEPCNRCIFSNRKCTYRSHPDNTDIVHPQSDPTNPSNITFNLSASTKGNSSRCTEPPPLTRPGNTCMIIPEQPDYSNVESPSVRQSSSEILTRDCDCYDLRCRIQKLEQALSAHSSIQSVPSHKSPGSVKIFDLKAPQYALEDSRLSLNKTRVYGQSHWATSAYQVSKLVTILCDIKRPPVDGSSIDPLKLEIRSLLQKCKYLARGTKMTRPSRCISCPELNLAIPIRALADRRARLYISRFESVFRILHIPSFWAEYEEYFRNPAAAPNVLRFKVQLVLAIGSSLHQDSRSMSEVRAEASQWVCTAHNWVSGPIEKDRLSISGLQVQCLLMLARQTLSIGGDLLWVSMGTVVRTAMQMGLHRDPQHFPYMSVLQAEIRRRLWATILELSAQSSLDSGMPPTISFNEFDTEAPANIEDEDLDECTKVLPEPSEIVTTTSLQIFLLQSLRPRFEILRCMNGIGSEISYDDVLALSAAISNACRDCASHVHHCEETGIETFIHNLADLSLRRFLLSLHLPFAHRAYKNPAFYYSRKISLDSAMMILSPPQDEHFSRLISVGGGVFKNRIIHASLAVTAELTTDLEEQGTMPNSQRPTKYRKMLINAVKEALSQAARRIEYGETNVKSHMSLSMMLRQAESTETGPKLERAIVQSAKDALEWSYSVMQARSRSAESWSSNEIDMTFLYGGQEEVLVDLNFDDLLQDTGLMGNDLFGPDAFIPVAN